MKISYFEVNKQNQFIRVYVDEARMERHKLTVRIQGKTYFAESAYEIPENLYGNILLMFVYKGRLYPLPKTAGPFQPEMARDYFRDDINAHDLIYENEGIKKKLRILEEKKEKLKNIIVLYKDMANWEKQSINVLLEDHTPTIQTNATFETSDLMPKNINSSSNPTQNKSRMKKMTARDEYVISNFMED